MNVKVSIRGEVGFILFQRKALNGSDSCSAGAVTIILILTLLGSAQSPHWAIICYQTLGCFPANKCNPLLLELGLFPANKHNPLLRT